MEPIYAIHHLIYRNKWHTILTIHVSLSMRNEVEYLKCGKNLYYSRSVHHSGIFGCKPISRQVAHLFQLALRNNSYKMVIFITLRCYGDEI